jgi:tetratricopeptide (TPR) repeat protein
MALAILYAQMDMLDREIAQFDLWIAAHGEDAQLAEALNDRCWARALAGRDLDKALSDCNRAIRLNGKSARMLDSRALVELRSGALDKAVADYDAALAQSPKQGWSLYGRGLAKLRLGRKAEGQADLAAATAVMPSLPERAKAYGIVPAQGS